VDFSALKIVIQEEQSENAEIAIQYGSFINTILTFIIVSFSIFIAVKVYNKMQSKLINSEEANPLKPAEPSKEEVLLTEIRDLLKK
jgi:large conductance mechanosensitive channel